MSYLILAKKIDKFRQARPGSALILTMFIMSGMLLVAMSGAYVVFLGIKAGGIQAQSTKAYYAAEAGAEKLLFEIRKNNYHYGVTPHEIDFPDILTSGAIYDVYLVSFPPLVFRSIGDFQNTKRSVEIRLGD